MSRPLRLLLAEVHRAEDPRTWSGTPSHMVRALRGAGVDLVVADQLMPVWSPILEGVQRLRRPVRNDRWLWEREPAVLRAHAKQVHRCAEEVGADAVLSPGALAVAHLPPGRPVALWADATFAGLVDYYAEYTGLSSRTLRLGHDAERRALDRADLLAFSSAWAADSAQRDYGADPRKTVVVPFGAEVALDAAHLPGVVADRVRRPLRLLLVGVDWERKGAPGAVAAARRLVADGRDVHVDVVGCRPPPGTSLPAYVTVHGFLRPEAPIERLELDALFRRATLLVVPSTAECFGLVYAEAAAWGLPSVGVDTGGVPSVVDDGVTGRLVPGPPQPAAIAEAVASLVDDPERYARAARAARAKYERELNWSSAVDTLLAHLERLVGR